MNARYVWEQKHSYEPDWKWDAVAESDNLWELIAPASNFKCNVTVSGGGNSHMQQRIRCQRTGKAYSAHLTKDQCLYLMAHDIAAEAIEENPDA